MFNLFDYIIGQIKNNLTNETGCSFEVDRYKNNPTRVINCLVDQGCFKVDSIQINGRYYEVKYKDLNLNAPSLKHLIRYDKSLSQTEVNDKLCYEECRAFSREGLTESDGAFAPDNVEKYDLTDYATFELFAQYKGYRDEEELNMFIQKGWIDRQSILDEYNEFLSQTIAPSYEFEDEDEEDESEALCEV